MISYMSSTYFNGVTQTLPITTSAGTGNLIGVDYQQQWDYPWQQQQQPISPQPLPGIQPLTYPQQPVPVPVAPAKVSPAPVRKPQEPRKRGALIIPL
jgi:hypothetical protein